MRYALHYLRRHYKYSNSLSQLAKHMREVGVVPDSDILYVVPDEDVSGAWEKASEEQRAKFLKEVDRLLVKQYNARRENNEQ